MAQPYKICPICNTANHRNAAVCSTCGAKLSKVEALSPEEADSKRKPLAYEYQHGETDLSEGTLRWRGGSYVLGGVALLVLLGCAGIILTLTLRVLGTSQLPAQNNLFMTATAASTDQFLYETNTPKAVVTFITVTIGPPTPTPTEIPTLTPTQGPCVQEVQPNDDLISILFRCGHRTIDNIMPLVLELNNLSDPSQLQLGQEIQVPWPTPTVDPNALPSATESADTGAAGETVVVADTSGGQSTGGIRQRPTETLQPGVTWHKVQKDENIIQIAFNYGATLRILSELNPEVTFSQCDFGLGSGGANCIVQLYEGQLIRVPAPTPTPTIQPTASGSETATPTATATFNAPSAISPSERAFFRNDELVTLRWIATGSLTANQSYMVTVRDENAQITYTGLTQELFFIVPEEWHNHTDDRHDYTWKVSVIDNDRPESPYFTTEARLFTWQGN